MSWLSWLVEDWRLKLLALGLAILMLGAVAFSQNPPTTKTLQVALHYTTVGPNQDLVIINPPSTVSVTFSGLADVIGNANANNFSATVDATRAEPGAAVKLNIVVTPTINVTYQNPAPIVVKIDKLAAIDVPVGVNARAAAGWVLDPDKTSLTPKTVQFVGPVSWEDHLVATLNVAGGIVGTQQLVNQPVQLTNSSGYLNVFPCTTVPCATLNPTAVAVTLSAHTGTTRITVPLLAAPPSQPPPAGYEITGIKVEPVTIIITGDPTALAKIQGIILPSVDLSGATSTTSITVNIPFPDGVTAIDGRTQAKIIYTIQRNPSVNPSP